MLKVILFTLIVLGALAGGSQVLLTNLIQATILIEDRSLVRTAINTIKQRSVSVDGEYYLPYGIKEASKQVLPVNFHGVRKSAKGHDFIYCPYSALDNISATEVVQMTAAASYEVTTDNTLVPTGDHYVTHSARPPVDGVAAILIVPSRSSYSPSCADVSVNAEGEYILTGDSEEQGGVYAVTFDEIAFMHRGGIREFVRVIDGNEDLQGVLETVSQKPGLDATITLQSGDTFVLDNNLNFTSSDPLKPRSIIIKSSTSAHATITGNAALVLASSGANITFENVTIGNNVSVSVSDNHTRIMGSAINTLTALRSTLLLDNTAFGANALSDTPLTAINSVIHQPGNMAIDSNAASIFALQGVTWRGDGNITLDYTGAPVVFQMQDSSFTLRNATISSRGSASALYYVDASSQLTLDNVTWSNSNGSNVQNGIYSLGRLDVSNSNLSGNHQVSSVIRTLPGAVSNVTSTTLGSASSRPTIGWQDEGSLSISGDVSIYAGTCQSGGRFVENDSTYTIPMTDKYVGSISFLLRRFILTQDDRDIPVDVDSFFVKANINCL